MNETLHRDAILVATTQDIRQRDAAFARIVAELHQVIEQISRHNDDLYSVALMGLWEACRQYDHQRDFLHFASLVMSRRVKTELYSKSRQTKFTVSMQSLQPPGDEGEIESDNLTQLAGPDTVEQHIAQLAATHLLNQLRAKWTNKESMVIDDRLADPAIFEKGRKTGRGQDKSADNAYRRVKQKAKLFTRANPSVVEDYFTEKGFPRKKTETKSMSIFNTAATPAQQAATQVLQIARNQFSQLSMSGRNGYNLIWNNRNATPADVIAALGTNAVSVFALANLNIETLTSAAEIAGVDAPQIPSLPDGTTVTFDSAGNGTLVQTSSSSSGASSSSSGNLSKKG